MPGSMLIYMALPNQWIVIIIFHVCDCPTSVWCRNQQTMPVYADCHTSLLFHSVTHTLRCTVTHPAVSPAHTSNCLHLPVYSSSFVLFLSPFAPPTLLWLTAGMEGDRFQHQCRITVTLPARADCPRAWQWPVPFLLPFPPPTGQTPPPFYDSRGWCAWHGVPTISSDCVKKLICHLCRIYIIQHVQSNLLNLLAFEKENISSCIMDLINLLNHNLGLKFFKAHQSQVLIYILCQSHQSNCSVLSRLQFISTSSYRTQTIWGHWF